VATGQALVAVDTMLPRPMALLAFTPTMRK
jgi:hypothetical protein